jgi:hypothetical protein
MSQDQKQINNKRKLFLNNLHNELKVVGSTAVVELVKDYLPIINTYIPSILRDFQKINMDTEFKIYIQSFIGNCYNATTLQRRKNIFISELKSTIANVLTDAISGYPFRPPRESNAFQATLSFLTSYGLNIFDLETCKVMCYTTDEYNNTVSFTHNMQSMTLQLDGYIDQVVDYNYNIDKEALEESYLDM